MSREKFQKGDDEVFQESEDLLITFRGVKKKIAEQAEQRLIDHPEGKNFISYSTWTKALDDKPVYRPIAESLSYFLGEVRRNPSAYCEPPDISDNFEIFAQAALAYAPSPWWYKTLEIDGLLTPDSFQSIMSRGRTGKAEEILGRAKRWRQKCLAALAEWEAWQQLSNQRLAELRETLVVEELLRKGDPRGFHDYIWAVLNCTIYPKSFDPQTCDPKPWGTHPIEWVLDHEVEAHQVFDDLVVNYDSIDLISAAADRDDWDDKQRETTIPYWSDDLKQSWMRQARVKDLHRWNKITRQFDVRGELLAVQHFEAASEALPHEEVQERVIDKWVGVEKKRRVIDPNNETGPLIAGLATVRERQKVEERYVVRWRDATHADKLRFADPVPRDRVVWEVGSYHPLATALYLKDVPMPVGE